MACKTIKVCMITTVHYPFDTRIFHKEAKTLAKAGYEVTLIAQHNKNEIIDGIKIIALPKPKNRLSRIFFLTRRAYILALEQNAEIYHFHDPEFLPWGKLLKNKTNKKVIYDVHEDYPADILTKSWIPKGVRVSISILFNIYEKKISKKFDSIIVAWPKIGHNFEKKEYKNIHVITNYPILEYFPLEKISKKDKNNSDDYYIKLIYVGGLTAIRGIKEIIRSLEHIKCDNIKLILVGIFQEKGLKEELIILSEWQKVEYKGWLTQKEAYKEMSQATIGLLCFLPAPCHIYSVTNKLFEYMAAGIPVIASNFYSFKNIIDKNKCGICVNPQNPKEIANAINYLIEHDEEARIMGENGRKAVKKDYNWENESIKLLGAYQRLRKFHESINIYSTLSS